MAMDAKDLRIESALGAHSDDGNTKYAQSGTTFQSNGNKQYHDIGSNSLSKVDVSTARPCAIIGPDRVVPPHSTNDAYVKKVPIEPWPCADIIYQHPPEYPHKPAEYQLSRNISPRQTFQENMQRIMVPPSYASAKSSEDNCLKNSKLMSLESKFCDVPYTISPINNEPKIVKSSDGLVLNNNSNQPVAPHGWASSGVNVRPLRPYGAPDLYQYSEYSNGPGPRPIPMIRPHRNITEEMPQVYQDRYHEANIRFKPYPMLKERPLQNAHARYEYIPNYPNAFQPHPAYPPHKYELQKSIPTHPYSVYPHVPLKYLERRMAVPTMDKYPRSPNQQVNFNQPFCNQNIPSTYGTVPGNCLQNRAYPYASDPSKTIMQNRLYFDNNNSRKYYPSSENMFINDINRSPTIKTDVMYSSYAPLNLHSLPPHHMYRKESSTKGYEHALHYRNIDYSANVNPLGRLPMQFSPQTISISPSDSNASIDTTRVLGNAQDDCGYASQSSTASIRSIDSGVTRMSHDMYRRHDMTLPHLNKFGPKGDTNTNSKDKKDLNVRQFLQMWNEGDDEGNDNNKESTKQGDSGNSQEQLYVLGLVNVPKEELGKYDHIQKISKLPENIKGYNSIELLNQYEKLVESSGLNQFPITSLQSKQKDSHVPVRSSFPRLGMEVSNASARPLSPLDVEAKISQSVIHKEVGCNFEIRPCSPQMMNVELATPVHNVLGERLIEKVINPVKTNSPICQRVQDSNHISSSLKSPKVLSCKMVNNQYTSPHVNEPLKTNYCLQDLESNSGVCLASLPRLDNDIELNFPEINQQFINDNKIPSTRDLPVLDTENSGNAHKSKSLIHNQSFITDHINSGSESDKDVSKLSKYRKQKRNSVANDSDDTLNMSLHRTNSVIIKNPENGKTPEEYVNNISLTTGHIPSIDNVENNANIVESNTAVIYSDEIKSETVDTNGIDYNFRDSDTAIDFSLNKCEGVESTSITSLSNSNDSVGKDVEIDKNGYANNDIFINSSDKHCSKKSPDQIKEIDAAGSFSTLQPNSPTFDNISDSKILSNNIMLESNTDDNLTLKTHESVITHSKSKEIKSDISFVNESSRPVEKVSHKDLPHLTNIYEDVSTNVSTCNSNVIENINVLSNCIEDQALNYCLVSDINLEVENLRDPIIIKETDNIDHSGSQQEETNNFSEKSVAETDPNTNIKNNIINDFTSQKSEEARMLIDSDTNEDTLNTMLLDVNETSNIQASKEAATNNKSEDIVNFPAKCSDENHIQQNLSQITGAYSTKSNSNELISISIKDCDSSNISCTDMTNIKTNDSQCKTKIDDFSDTIHNKKEISSTLLNGNSSTELNKYYMNVDHLKYDFTFYKELISPRIQNLLLYNEGVCNCTESFRNDEIEKDNRISNIKSPCPSLKEISKASVEPNIGNINVDPELKNKTNDHISNYNNIKNINASNETTEVEINEELTTRGNNHENDHDANNIAIVLDKALENNMLNDMKSNIESDSLVGRNCDSEPEAAETAFAVNHIGVDDKIDNHVEVKNAFHYVSNRLPNKRNRILKRSLSESAVTEYTAIAGDSKESYDNNFIHGRKRAKISDSEIFVESQVLTENFTNFIQNNRRNSVSTIYNDENVSFCIFIENDCVLSEENETCQKICYTELPDECLTAICTEDVVNSELNEDISYEDTADICGDEDAAHSEMTTDVCYEGNNLTCSKDSVNSEFDSKKVQYEETEQCPYENDLILESVDERTIDETWVEDVACMETVFSDDIAEDIVISASSSPKDSELSDDEGSNTNYVYTINENEHTNKVKHIYGNQMCDDDAQLVDKLFRTPQMNVNKTLTDRESHLSQEYHRYYDNESLEKVLSDCNALETHCLDQSDSVSDKSFIPSKLTSTVASDDEVHGNKENLQDFLPTREFTDDVYSSANLPDIVQSKITEETKSKEYGDRLIHSCESSCDNFVSCKKEEKLQYAISSSPEVSSTTSEEKGPAILLKIRNYKGSKISEVNDMSASFNYTHSQRPLITKAAQKYIPPLKETIHDLKVKIRLPKQSLYKLQQLKKSKEKPKIDPNSGKVYIKSIPQGSPKKAKLKPKFEDVLMSIDEIQFKKLKKNKKSKQPVPKVIIKKNENGAHYASTQSKETFNPDLTGRKWQPWVFLEKSNFVDKMALKQKFKAVYSHRKKTFVLAENFRKYKSISNAKFVMSHPKSNDNISTGNLKYTFRLKHS